MSPRRAHTLATGQQKRRNFNLRLGRLPDTIVTMTLRRLQIRRQDGVRETTTKHRLVHRRATIIPQQRSNLTIPTRIHLRINRATNHSSVDRKSRGRMASHHKTSHMDNHLLLARMDSRDMMTGISMDKEGTATNKGRHTEIDARFESFPSLLITLASLPT